MQKKRRSSILGGIALLVALFFLSFSQIITGYVGIGFFWGLPIGIPMGFLTCLYLYYAWDPELLEPKDVRNKADSRVLWLVPLGVVTASIISSLVEQKTTDLLAGSIISWLFITFGYMIIQAWRYRED